MKEEGCVNLGTKAESRRDACKVGTTDVRAHSARARCEIAQEFQGPRGCGATWDQPLPSLWIFQGNWFWVGCDPDQWVIELGSAANAVFSAFRSTVA